MFVGDRSNGRVQIFEPDGTFVEWRQCGRPSGMFIDEDNVLYVTDSTSTSSNPGIKRGIYIGSAVDGTVHAYIPDPGGAAGRRSWGRATRSGGRSLRRRTARAFGGSGGRPLPVEPGAPMPEGAGALVWWSKLNGGRTVASASSRRCTPGSTWGGAPPTSRPARRRARGDLLPRRHLGSVSAPGIAEVDVFDRWVVATRGRGLRLCKPREYTLKWLLQRSSS